MSAEHKPISARRVNIWEGSDIKILGLPTKRRIKAWLVARVFQDAARKTGHINTSAHMDVRGSNQMVSSKGTINDWLAKNTDFATASLASDPLEWEVWLKPPDFAGLQKDRV